MMNENNTDYIFKMYQSPEEYGVIKLSNKVKDLSKAISELIEVQRQIIDIIRNQQRRISDIKNELYEIAPEKEVIDTMADEDEPDERQMMIDLYLNRNENYFREYDRFKKICDGLLAEAKKSNPDASYTVIREQALALFQAEKRCVITLWYQQEQHRNQNDMNRLKDGI